MEDTFQFNKGFIKNVMKKVMQDVFSKLVFNILKNYMNFIMIYHFQQEEWNLKKSKSLLLIYTIKIEYVIHMRNLTQTLNHGLILKKVHRVIRFNQNAWLKPHVEMNTKPSQKAKT